MKVGFGTPFIKKCIAARASVKRYDWHSLGIMAYRGYGWTLYMVICSF
jgi:hypothetical protein